MSRVGKKPIDIPTGVQVQLSGQKISVRGPKGELSEFLPKGVAARVEGGKLRLLVPEDAQPQERANHGLARSRVANMVKGVTEGFVRRLEINGVGYRAELNGDKLNLVVGLSHPVEFALPPGLQVKSEKTKSTVNAGQDAILVTVSGTNNEVLGQFVSKLRNVRPPEPYKGKGIKFLEERIIRKVGKTGTS